MSAPESLSPAFSCTPPLLGVRGAKMYLQVKGAESSFFKRSFKHTSSAVGGGASRIPAVTQVPESQVTPPENRMVGSSNLRATFTKSSPPETKEVELKQGTGALAEPLIASRPVGKRGAPRGIGRGRAKNHGRGKSTAAEGRPTKTESSVGTRKKVARGNRGVTVGRRELQKILQSRKRQLYLSRKYGVIWGRKVFGRVLPSAARRHHTHQLKRRSIGAWSQVWWSARREWKLNIRADCHNRYRLWMLVWKYWTEFVRGRKQRRAIKQLAICHNERRVVKRVWGGWSEYLRGKRERLESRETAQQWHLAVTLRRGWMRWRESLERKKGRDIMLAAALQHWATRLQSQVWVHWVERCREMKTEREKTTAAERHWAARKKATCWTAWTTYIEYRGKKRHMKEVAEKRYGRCVLRRVLTTWQERHERARELAQFQEQVEERGRRAVARRVIFYWKHYMELVFYKEHLMQIATFHYHTVLKSKAVACLRTYSQRQQLQRRHKTAAERFRRLKVLGNGWRQWLERCEHCEEIKMLPFTRRARQHFRLCSLRQFFPTWKRFVLLRRRRKTQIALADQHFKSTALPKCFVVLRDYAGVRSYKRELLCQAQSFRRENLLSMAFYQWWRTFHVSRDLHAMEKMAMLHCEEVVKRASLGRWRVQTDSRLRQLGLEHSAVVHHRRWLLSSALRQWRDCRRRCAVSVRQFSTAQRHHAHKSIKHVWNAWQEYVGRRRAKKAKTARGAVHYHGTLLQRTLKGWQVHHCCAVKKKEKRSTAELFHSLSLERSVLRLWRENVQWCQFQRDLEETALAHFEKTTYAKCFNWWREQTVVSIETACRERERVQEITSILCQRKLVRVLTRWREYSNSSVARRIVWERATVHFHHRLLHSCFTAWHSHYRLSLRKMLLGRQCAHFLRNRLVSTFYAKWRVELMRAVVMKQKSVLALWHWSQSLQRKALVCWLMYVMNRKRKAERYAQAMKRYRSRLLHIGVTQWIEFATSMQAQRAEYALQHQTQITQSVMQCVRRCARRWRDGVRKGRSHDPQTQPTTIRTRQQTGTRASAAQDIWTTIARKHQIPSASVRQRPQPRQPEYLESQSKLSPQFPNSDLIPRSNIPHPVTPPVPYDRRLPEQRVGGRDGILTAPSFTFLPSTVSVLSSPPSDHWQVQHSDPHTVGGLCQGPLPVTRVPETEFQQSLSPPRPVLLPPSAFSSNRPTSDTASAHRGPPTAALAGQRVTTKGGEVSGLDDPAVRSRIVHVRDELRRYHQMRVKKRTLEQQVADSSSPQLAELQAEFGRTVEELHRTEPMLLELVAQVQHHLSHNPT